MKLKVLFIALLMVIGARVAMGQSDPFEYKVETIEDHARVKSFKYISYDQCYADAQDEARNEGLSHRKEAELLASVPKGGVLQLELLGNEWRMANGPNWTYLITDEAGNMLFRSKGNYYSEPAPGYEVRKDVVKTKHGTYVTRQETQIPPQKDDWGRPVYIMRDQKSISVRLPDTFKVFIIDSINDNRCIYLISKGKFN
ncbi:MAG: hypothetical protein WCI90_00705 [Chlorobium sp.]|nr:MAG: hypothetical protein FDX17_05035 [Chlorobium sp.]